MAFDYSDNPLTRLRRRVATIFSYSPIVTALGGTDRSVQIYDRPHDIRGDLEEGGLDPVGLALVTDGPRFQFNVISDTVVVTVRYTAMIFARTTTDVTPSEYFQWHLAGAMAFLYDQQAVGHSGPITDEGLDPSPLDLESIELAGTAMEKKLVLESENDGWVTPCDIIVAGKVARGDMKVLSA